MVNHITIQMAPGHDDFSMQRQARMVGDELLRQIKLHDVMG